MDDGSTNKVSFKYEGRYTIAYGHIQDCNTNFEMGYIKLRVNLVTTIFCQFQVLQIFVKYLVDTLIDNR